MGSMNIASLLMSAQSNKVSTAVDSSTSIKDVKNDKDFGQVLNRTTKSQDIQSEKTQNQSTQSQDTQNQKTQSQKLQNGKVDNNKLKKDTDQILKLKQKQSTKSKKTTSVKDEEAIGEETQAAILNTLSQELQMPLDEIVGVLQDLELRPIDLLEEGNFSQFINALYNDQSTESLLMQDTNLKDISKLFSKLEEVASTVIGDELHQVLQEKIQIGEEVITDTQSVVSSLESSLQEDLGNVLPEEVINSIWKTKEEAPKTLQNPLSDMMTFEDTPDLSMGLTVPIESFKSTMNLNDESQLAAHINTRTQEVVVKPYLNIANQIVDNIEVTKLEQMQEIKMQLKPKELGELTIKLTEKSGTIIAEIKVENEKTKDFVVGEIDSLKDSLTKQGIDVGHVQVDVRQNDREMQMYQQRQKSSKRIQEIIQKHLDELEAEEAEIANSVKASVSDSEVDYMV